MLTIKDLIFLPDGKSQVWAGLNFHWCVSLQATACSLPVFVYTSNL